MATLAFDVKIHQFKGEKSNQFFFSFFLGGGAIVILSDINF